MEMETRVESQTVQPKTKCPKCGGNIVVDLILCIESNGGWVEDVHCIHCGERFFDPETERRRSLKLWRKG
jgi:transcription elongation factor Elf1